MVSVNVTASGGVPAVVADLDLVSSAEPPAERTVDRVRAEVIEATIVDAFGAGYDVRARFTLPNESMDAG